jgi:hypothetical protein
MAGPLEDTLTLRQGYEAMCEFLRGLARGEGAPPEVGRLLSDLVLLSDGRPAVDEMWPRWLQAVRTVRACEGSVAGYLCRGPPSVSLAETQARGGPADGGR